MKVAHDNNLEHIEKWQNFNMVGQTGKKEVLDNG